MRSILRRIAGVAIMVRALTPLFLLLVLLVAALLALGPIRRIGESMDNIRASIDPVKGTLDDVRDEIAKVSETAEGISNTVNALPNAVRLDLDTITVPQIETAPVKVLGLNLTTITSISMQPVDLNLSFDVPGIPELQAITGVVQSLGNSLGELTGLVSITAELGVIANEIRTIGLSLSRVFGLGNARLGLRVLKWIAVLLIISWFISYLANLGHHLGRGWAMARGLPDRG